MEGKTYKPAHMWAWVTGVILVVVAVIVVSAIIFASGTKTVAVPNITGLTEEQARQALSKVGLTLQTQTAYATSEFQKAGMIVAQDPVEGVEVDDGSTITATVIVEMRMPDVVGMSQSNAMMTLNGQGITLIEIKSASVLDPSKIGAVLLQSPLGGTLVTPETSISLQVGGETENVIVPNVIGVSESNARTQLENAGLKAKVTEQASNVVQPGLVLSQSPSAGQPVQKGTTVDIVVSKAPTTGQTTP